MGYLLSDFVNFDPHVGSFSEFFKLTKQVGQEYDNYIKEAMKDIIIDIIRSKFEAMSFDEEFVTVDSTEINKNEIVNEIIRQADEKFTFTSFNEILTFYYLLLANADQIPIVLDAMSAAGRAKAEVDILSEVARQKFKELNDDEDE